MTDSDQEKQLGARLGQALLSFRWPLILLTVLFVALMGSGGRFLEFNQNYQVFFDDDNPQLQSFLTMQEKYTKSDTIFVAVIPRDGKDVFDPDVLAGIEELTAGGWQLPYSIRVDSITNYQHTYVEDNDLIVDDLITDAPSLSNEDIAQARNAAMAEPSLVNRLIAEDGGATGVNITFELPGESVTETPEAVDAMRALEKVIEAKYPIDLHLGGIVALNNSFFESSMIDMNTLVPAMYLVIILVTLILVRSVTATIGTVLVIGMSVATGMGLAGWLGIQLTPPSSAAPTIIMTLAVADSIHMLMTMSGAMRKGASKRQAIIESLRLNLQPIFLTSITTAVGFLSLNFSDAQPFRDLGNITAIGVMAAFAYSIVFLPVFLAVLPMKVSQKETAVDRYLERLGVFVTRYRTRVLVASLVVCGIFLSFIPNNTLNDDFVNYFDERTAFRQATDITTEKLTGVYVLQFDLEAGSDNGIYNPEYLQQVESFTEWLKTQPEVTHVDSIIDTFRRLNRNLHGDDPAYYRIPEDTEEAAQYLLLYEFSLPFGLDLNNQIDLNKSATQVRVTLDNIPSGELLAITHRAEQWLETHTKLNSVGVGPAIMFAYISERNIKSMIVGTLVAIFVIALIIMLALRSVKIGLISLIPNLLPAGIAFGIWGMFVGEINVAVSMVMGMTLGIVVDDTVHFLSKYLRGVREYGKSGEQAIQYAFKEVGSAILVTSFILAAGFTVLAQSTFAMNSNMATLTTIAVLAALVADLLLLPTLLLLLDRRKTVPAESTGALANQELSH